MEKKKEEEKDFWDNMDNILKEAAKKAIAETHAAGRASTHGDSQGIYHLYPGGKKEYIKLYGDDEN